MKAGLFWGVALVAGAVLLRLAGVRHEAGNVPGMADGIAYGFACLFAVLRFARLSRRTENALRRVPASLCLGVLVLLLCVPLLAGWRDERSFGLAGLAICGLVLGAGIGEEIFYRGYVQSRINASFGRPFRLGGVEFGAGLLISSVMFGFLHVLNSVDYFHGRFDFAWGFGATTFGTGLLFGCLRESTGTIVAGTVAHSVLDVLASASTGFS